MRIDGGGRITLRGPAQAQVATLSPGTRVVFERLDIEGGGSMPNFGGAIFSEGFLTLRAVRLTGHQAVDGGAIWNSGSLTILDSTVTDNYATGDGGGIWNGGDLLVVSSTLEKNLADRDGGAIRSAGSGELRLEASSLLDNRAARWGGAIYSSGGLLNLVNSTLAGNEALAGGALRSAQATVRLDSSTLKDNSASALNGGGGIFINGGQALVSNSIIAGSTSLSGNADCVRQNGSVLVQASLIEGGNDCATGSTSALSGDPLLGPRTGGVAVPAHYPPLPGSPVLDRGIDEEIPAGITRDQIGNPRIFNGRVDLGSIELFEAAMFADGFED